jgi:hypothetical protein
MRQIFSILNGTTTVAPNCKIEEDALTEASIAYNTILVQQQNVNTRLKSIDLNLSYQKDLEAKQIELDLANDIKIKDETALRKALVEIRRPYGDLCDIPWYCNSLNNNISICDNNLASYKTIAAQIASNLSILADRIAALEKEQKDLTEESKSITQQLAAAGTAIADALDAYISCNNSQKFNKDLNLKTSCKQIKQKIKTINQKIISLTNQSLDVKYGTDNLPIMKINKKLSSFALNITNKILNELDKAKSTISKEYLSLFSNFYKQTKDKLASYEKQKIMLEVKITKSKQKKENILTDLPKLKKVLSNTIQKFANCKTPTVI